jgi:hypothetical protein
MSYEFRDITQQPICRLEIEAFVTPITFAPSLHEESSARLERKLPIGPLTYRKVMQTADKASRHIHCSKIACLIELGEISLS